MGRGAVAQLVHLGDVRLALDVAPKVLEEHDALARRPIDPDARRVVLPLVVANEQLRDTTLRELRLERGLVARHLVVDVDEVFVLAKRTHHSLVCCILLHESLSISLAHT